RTGAAPGDPLARRDRRPGLTARVDQAQPRHHRDGARRARARVGAGDVRSPRPPRGGEADRADACDRPAAHRPLPDARGREGAEVRAQEADCLAGGTARAPRARRAGRHRTVDRRAGEVAGRRVTRLRLASRRTFASLRRHRNYRLFFYGQLTSVAGTWMQNIAMAWLVVQLAPHSRGLAVGLLAACRFGPFTVLGLFAGVVTDRLDNRRVVMLT